MNERLQVRNPDGHWATIAQSNRPHLQHVLSNYRSDQFLAVVEENMLRDAKAAAKAAGKPEPTETPQAAFLRSVRHDDSAWRFVPCYVEGKPDPYTDRP